ncbi:cytochrome P450 [Nocardia sp. NPDC006630]|uniref:cytochrome P450 n=1 Tax=Nocardia sp. NPDC006630 TaxID=3157181 RepID=UPI0033ADB01B
MSECPIYTYPSKTPRSLALDPIMTEVAQGAGVARLQLPYGEPCWLVTRYDDVRTVYVSKKFSRAAMAEESAPRLTSSQILQGAIGSMEERVHVKLRRAVLGALDAPRLAKLETGAVATMATQLDALALLGCGDYSSQVAEPFAMCVLCDLLGLPDSDTKQIMTWVQTVLVQDSRPDGDFTAAMTEIGLYAYSVIVEREKSPGTDFISALIEAGGLSKKECAIIVIGLLFGGFESSATMLTKMVLRMLTTPEPWNELRHRPELVPNAIEEMLRTISVAGGESIPWRVMEPLTLAEIELQPGDYVMPATGPANFDPRIFQNPEDVVLDRNPNPHLTFGRGLNMCLGYQIARMEMNVGIRMLLEKYPDARVAVSAEKLHWDYSSSIWRLSELPLELNYR